MRYYVDTEFFDRPEAPTELISIALVADTGAEFYAISSEFDRAAAAAEPFLAEHVLPHLGAPGAPAAISNVRIAAELAAFCEQVEPADGDTRRGEMWAWNGAYDFYLLCKLYGVRDSIPAAVPYRFCDLKQKAFELGNPAVPEIGAGAHDALADARHDRVIYRWLVDFERARERKRAERVRARLLGAVTATLRDAPVAE